MCVPVCVEGRNVDVYIHLTLYQAAICVRGQQERYLQVCQTEHLQHLQKERGEKRGERKEEREERRKERREERGGKKEERRKKREVRKEKRKEHLQEIA